MVLSSASFARSKIGANCLSPCDRFCPLRLSQRERVRLDLLVERFLPRGPLETSDLGSSFLELDVGLGLSVAGFSARNGDGVVALVDA